MIYAERLHNFPAEALPGLDFVLQKIYASRLNNPQELDVHWRYLLPPTLGGLESASSRIIEAIEKQQQICIYGDYDVDGACASALLYSVLRNWGAQIDYFLPLRDKHGYGLSVAGIDSILAQKKRPDLIITVDNGIKAHAGSAYLAELKIDLIITDHHLADEILPAAVAIINPHCCDFPSKTLSGVGVAFYLAWALQEKLGKSSVPISAYLALVAIGTIADVMPLDYNNRILITYGLQQIRRENSINFKELAKVCKIDLANFRAQDISFAFAPRLNSAGRMADMTLALQFLLCDDENQAQILAQQLQDLNQFRREQEALYLQQEALPAGDWLYLYLADAPTGILGIIAAKIAQKSNKSALVASKQDDIWSRASLRGSGGIKQTLDKIALNFSPDDFIYGGHEQAAGLSIKTGKFSQLIEALSQEKMPQNEKIFYHDGELASAYFNSEWAKKLNLLEPWSNDFPEPIFFNQFEILELENKSEHCRLTLREIKGNLVLKAFYFFHNLEKSAYLGKTVKIAFNLTSDNYQGRDYLKLIIRNIEEKL